MTVNTATVSVENAPQEGSKPRLISSSFLVLRSLTAAGAFGVGLVQTLVFARILNPHEFSIFILIAAIGASLWLCDLGLAKILFVELRAARLSGRVDDRAAGHATAVLLLYGSLAVAGSLICFVVMATQPSTSLPNAVEFSLFFLYVALNLCWISMRSISIAVDEYLFYEKLELTRRVVNIATMLAMLCGLPFFVFVGSSNVLWIFLIIAAAVRLIRRGALAPRLYGFGHELVRFFRTNRKAIARSGTYALSDLFTYMFPYYIVPVMFGLGAPVIILEVTFRIFRGASMIYMAACDLAVPGQTRSFAARDAAGLMRTTLLAVGLCCVPAAASCGLLIFAARPLFAFLLRHAAYVPPQVTWILIVLLLANLVQMLSQSLLQYTGFFHEVARVGAVIAGAMVLATIVSILMGFGIVGFLACYAAVYSAGAISYGVAAVRGPIRAASQPHPAGA